MKGLLNQALDKRLKNPDVEIKILELIKKYGLC